MSALNASPGILGTELRNRPVRRARLSRKAMTGQILLYLILLVIAAVYISPFLIQIATSFKTEPDAAANAASLIPQTWTVAAYSQLFQHTDFPLWFMNSAIVTVFVTFGRIFFDSLAGYALARIQFRGRNLVFSAVVAIMAVPSVVLMLPKFLIINQLGMYDTYFGMIIPLLADAAGVFIMKNFFEAIPASVEEQARIDGAGTFRVFWSVVLPMARPALMTITILSFQGSWNELGQFLISTQSPSLMTLTKGMAQLVAGGLGAGTRYPLKLAGSLIMTLPVIVVFFIFQKRIVNNSAGAVKE